MEPETTAAQLELTTRYDAVVAEQLVKMLAELGVAAGSAEEINADQVLRNKDLVELGLGSLDWIRLAVWVGNETGLDLPQWALVDASHRTVAGWAEALELAARPGLAPGSSGRP
ncbi:acyl carrier protein [Streptacidiphilus melanogenes]|uniref:acyl carrier protein n=1 Tax=Streptacidiphilus melanogenes TaxID=411235 RepID=UPI0005A89A56|nr:acyl carrier protein [Streptacidiphilus melanogenes]